MDWKNRLAPLLNYRQQAQWLGLLGVLALGLALGTNALIAKLLTVDGARLSAVQSVFSPGGSTTTTTAKNSEDGPNSPPVATASNRSSQRAPAGSRKLNFYLNPISRRNLFDSANVAASQAPEPSGTKDGSDEAKASDIDAVLISAAVATDSRWSTALIAVASAEPQVFRIGDPIFSAIIHDIQRPWLDPEGAHHPARVLLKRDGELEYIEAGGKKKKKKGKKKGKKKTDSKKKAKSSGKKKWDGIHDKGGGRYTIEQGEIDYALANLDKLAREARIVPNFADGATNGFKVFSIRRNSALRKMGLKNNDVLTSVNGFDLSNTEKALEVYSKLQTEKNITLEVLRNGEPTTLEYEIQ